MKYLLIDSIQQGDVIQEFLMMASHNQDWLDWSPPISVFVFIGQVH